jgi:hypothetical protein
MNLSSEQRYRLEQLMARLGSFKDFKTFKVTNPTKQLVSPLVWMPVWIHMDHHFVRLNTKDEVELACKLTCIYHNGLDNRASYCDDGWHHITHREAFLALAGTRTPESDSSDEAGVD